MSEETFLVPDHSSFPNFPDFEPPDVNFPFLPDTAGGDLKLEELNVDLDFSDVDLFPVGNDDCGIVSPSVIASNSDSGSDPGPIPIPGSPDSGKSVAFGNSNLSLKRKIDPVSINSNPSLSKSRKSNDVSSLCGTTNTSDGSERNDEDDDEKRKFRLMRNRESAQLSRQRKRNYVEELEQKLKILNSTAADLNGKLTFYMTENNRLVNQLAKSSAAKTSNGAIKSKANIPQANPMPPPPHFAWVPYIRFPMKMNGKNGYVPIPRLQTHTISATGAKGGKGSSKKKKVASVSFLGLFAILLIFGGLMNFQNSVSGNKVIGSNKGRVYDVEAHDSGIMNSTNKEFSAVNDNNSTESMRALLYVPRNGRHVEINGNLIIHSGLPSERAMTQVKSKEKAKDLSGKEGTGLANPSILASALALPKSVVAMCRRSKSCKISAEYQRALPSESRNDYGDNINSNLDDGPFRQWFREGLTGPILSSGTCSKVYQFETAASTPTVPKRPSTNTSDKLPPKKTIKNRRILYGKAIPLNGTTVNNNTKSFANSSESSESSMPASSMVVSILADPREVVDGDGMIAPKALSRIFVVVLVDKVKYVTYSCTLPFKSSHGPHLVN